MIGALLREARDALRDAFDFDELDQMLRFRMSIVLRDIVERGPMETVAFKLLDRMDREGRECELLEAAYRERPYNVRLRAVYQKLGLAPKGFPVTQPALEKIIFQSKSILNMAAWCTKAARVQDHVCRIEIQGQAAGTGFLVGPETLLTNYHVLESVIKGTTPVTAVGCRFDYKQLAGGTILSGAVYHPHADGVLDHSPYSQADLEGQPFDVQRSAEELDYALLRVENEPGNQNLDAKGGAGAPVRGWVAVPQGENALVEKAPLYIVQHPRGAPVSLALDTEAVVGVSSNRTRVRYTTNTEAGSSGSPCFNQQWELVALHHYGDPAYFQPKFNQGIPIGVIRSLLQQRGQDKYLGPEPP